MITLLTGDCRDILPTLPTASVQTVVTSPPYYGLRDYGTGTWEGGDSTCSHVEMLPDWTRDPGDCDGRISVAHGQSANIAKALRRFGGVCRACGATLVDRQIGREPRPDCLAWARAAAPCGACYVCALRAVFAALWPVLRDDGTAWLNLGDSYASDSTWGGATSGMHVRALHGDSGIGRRRTNTGLPSKSLMLIPSRVALALQVDGWVVRSDIVWAKESAMPESVKDRPTRAHETIYLLAKQAHYYYDAAAVAEPAVTVDRRPPNGSKAALRRGETYEHSGRRTKDEVGSTRYTGFNDRLIQRPQLRRALALAEEHNLTQAHLDAIRAAGLSDAGQVAATQTGTGANTPEVQRLAAEAKAALGGYYREFLLRDTRNLRDVWTINPKPSREGHYAMFPEEIPDRCIRASTRPGDTVLDPFGGSGTTGRVAERLGRHATLIELNPDYLSIQERRLNGVQREMLFEGEAAA